MIYIFRKTYILALALAVFALGSFSFVQAETVIRSGETLSIAEDQLVEGDLYAAAGTVNISGEAGEDVVIMGGQITINGDVKGNAFLFGGSVDVHGEVADDLRIVSGEVIVAEHIEGDLFVVGGSVLVLSSASISGDVLLYAGEAVIEGSVGGDVLGSIDNLRVDSEVAGGINVRTVNLVLGDRANIQGDVSYTSNRVLERSLNAVVEGELVRSDPIIKQDESKSFSWLVPSLVLLFSVLVWYLMSKKTLNLMTERALIKSPRPILLGLAFAVFTPVIIASLMVSLIGSLVSFVFLSGYVLFILLSIIGMIALLGQVLMIAFNRSTTNVSALSLLVGTVGFIFLSMLNIVGQLIMFIFMMIALGALVDLLIRREIKE